MWCPGSVRGGWARSGGLATPAFTAPSRSRSCRQTLAGDPDRLTRFHREARLLAALSHSGIATLFGFEEIDGQPVLVMELVEGETLAERLSRGPMPVDESLDVARKVAEALEEAHEKGIVHRDLKPANVKTTPDGKVKVLDFGLAKAFASNGLDQGRIRPTISRTPRPAR